MPWLRWEPTNTCLRMFQSRPWMTQIFEHRGVNIGIRRMNTDAMAILHSLTNEVAELLSPKKVKMPIKQPSWIKIHRQNGYERVLGRQYKFATSQAILAIHFLSQLICLRPRLVFTWPIIKVSTEPCSLFAQRFLSHWQVAWILLRHLVWYSQDIFSLVLILCEHFSKIFKPLVQLHPPRGADWTHHVRFGHGEPNPVCETDQVSRSYQRLVWPLYCEETLSKRCQGRVPSMYGSSPLEHDNANWHVCCDPAAPPGQISAFQYKNIQMFSVLNFHSYE